MLLRPTRLVALTTALLLTPTVAVAAATPSGDAADAQLLLLLDASRSMEDPDAQGEPKIDAAKAALGTVIDSLDPAQSVGLRVFGGSVPVDQPRAQKCSDSELVVPIGTGNASELRAAVEDYTPTGETPIAYALQQAGEDLAGEGQRSVVLVSDGIATCDPDPCEVAEQLTADGLDLVIHTVGLGADEETRTQLQCIAEAGGGTYSDAADTESLTSVLTQVSTRAFRPFTIEGTPVVGTPDAATAPVIGPGQYTDAMPEDPQEERYYRIPRSGPGTIVHAGVTMRPVRGGTSSYQVYLETADGRGCGGNVAMPWSAGAGHSFGTTSVTSAEFGADGPCHEAEELVLRVVVGNGSEPILGTPFELVVVEEPRVTNVASLEAEDAPDPEWAGTSPAAPVAEVVAGSSLNNAPLLEPGQTYSSVLTRGEMVFFRVPVQHGQRLEALAEFPRPTGLLADSTRPVSDIADVLIVGPTRGEAHAVLADLGDLDRRAIMQADKAVQAAATTYEVRWANHAGASSTGASMAGDYYIGVGVTSSEDLLLPMPFTITTALVGEVSGVPEYASADQPDDTTATTGTTGGGTTDATATPTQGPVEEAAPDVATDQDADGAGWLPWTLGAGGVLLAGAGAVLLGLRRA